MTDHQARLASRVSKATTSVVTLLAREAEALERTGVKVTMLLRGEPDFDTPAHVIAAGQKAMAEGYSHYTVAEGVLPLREAVAAHVQRVSGQQVDGSSEVLITTGATMGLYIAFMALLDPGDEVVVPEPYYGPSARMIELASARMVTVPLARDGARLVLDVDAIASRVTPRTKLILINSPMNPTGRVFTREELTRLGELAVERDLVIVSDECYDAIVFDGRPYHAVAALAPEFRERTIAVNSFSKTYAMTGWRLGYNVAPKALTAAMNRVYSQSGRCAAAFTQQAGLAALGGPQDVVREMREEYQRRREIVVARLADIGLPCATPEGTFYVYPDCARFGLPSYELAQHILQVGHLAVTPGAFFGPGADSYIRLSFAASDEDLDRGLTGLGKAIASLPVAV